MENDDIRDWNYDRILSAKHIVDAVMTDMLIVLHRGKVSGNIKSRMAEFLRNAAEEIDRCKTS